MTVGVPYFFLLSAFITAILWPVDSVISPFFSKIFVDNVIEGKGVITPLVSILVLKSALRFSDFHYKIHWSKFISGFQNKIRQWLFDYVHEHSEGFFDVYSSSAVSRRLIDMADRSEVVLDFIFSSVLPFICGAIGAIILTYQVSFIFALLFSVWLIIHFGIGLFLATKGMAVQKKQASLLVRLASRITDSFTNNSTVKIFRGKDRELSLFEKYNMNESDAKQSAVMSVARIELVLNVFEILFSIISLVLLLHFWNKKMVSPGDFILIYGLYDNFSWIINWLFSKLHDVLQDIGVIEEGLDILLSDREGVCLSEDELLVQEGKIEFVNVDFSYPDGKQVLSEFNLTIMPGEKVAVVGKSGSGKSTLIKLILRLFKPQHGTIMIDGRDIKEVKKDSLRANIAIVSQETVLFDRSVKENVSYPNEVDIDIMSEAFRLAHADFVHDLPGDIDFNVGEKGSRLSGGERQRLGIARAFLQVAPILLLDEPTSAVDAKSEKYIADSIYNLTKNRTCLTISHKLALIKEYDRIIVMKKGKIIEEGTHKKLIKKAGLYKEMWQLQNAK